MTTPAPIGLLPLYDVPRRCRCGHEWVGQSFTPVADGEVLPRGGVCPKCAVADDARLAELTRGPLTQRAGPPPKEPRAFTAVPKEEDWWDR